jgi:hypothetical protein
VKNVDWVRFEYKMPRKTFGKRQGKCEMVDEISVRNFSLNYSPSIIKRHNSIMISWAEHVESTGQITNSYEILVRNSKRKVTLRTPAHKWDDNIKIWRMWIIFILATP